MAAVSAHCNVQMVCKTPKDSVVLALGDYTNVQCHACIGETSKGKDIAGLNTRNIKMLEYTASTATLPTATQVVLLSATLPYDVLEMTTQFMTDPIRILLVKGDELTPQSRLDLRNKSASHKS
ncbi:hypothetical protein C8F01DRAFT_1370760 [Mycena amicta]|nr:hypothetical protein C8F01DRAFT_1370760 [Mycena amicta]